MNDAAPGWYPDPKDASQLRWFDGRFWTDQQGETPPPAPPTRRTGLLVSAGIAAGVVVLGVLVAAAVPVYKQEHERARLESVTSMSCDDVADEAVELGRTEKELAPLESVASTAVARDDRDVVRIPAPGAEAFVMSCSGMGTRPDGSVAPLTIDLYIDHERTHLLWYTWQT
ncbi:DUF2510 domain-containing protein [Cellulomonas sp. McL0617]|uniref:DUF2510 domain-containing protein n=1 Tax=Cellulomonas sp. McL0617 TaxID=3415675 RepID=UPI003CF384D7